MYKWFRFSVEEKRDKEGLGFGKKNGSLAV